MECTTGKPPFAEKSVPETINSLANNEPIPLRKLSPETPEEFEELINRLLRKKPEERFGTAQALNRRLVDLLEIIKAEADAQTAIAQTAVPLEPSSTITLGRAICDWAICGNKIKIAMEALMAIDGFRVIPPAPTIPAR